jgi:NADH-quinone oxidoreductase subunit C
MKTSLISGGFARVLAKLEMKTARRGTVVAAPRSPEAARAGDPAKGLAVRLTPPPRAGRPTSPPPRSGAARVPAPPISFAELIGGRVARRDARADAVAVEPAAHSPTPRRRVTEDAAPEMELSFFELLNGGAPTPPGASAGRPNRTVITPEQAAAARKAEAAQAAQARLIAAHAMAAYDYCVGRVPSGSDARPPTAHASLANASASEIAARIAAAGAQPRGESQGVVRPAVSGKRSVDPAALALAAEAQTAGREAEARQIAERMAATAARARGDRS